MMARDILLQAPAVKPKTDERGNIKNDTSITPERAVYKPITALCNAGCSCKWNDLWSSPIEIR
jgi:hypothetical protein